MDDQGHQTLEENQLQKEKAQNGKTGEEKRAHSKGNKQFKYKRTLK